MIIIHCIDITPVRRSSNRLLKRKRSDR